MKFKDLLEDVLQQFLAWPVMKNKPGLPYNDGRKGLSKDMQYDMKPYEPPKKPKVDPKRKLQSFKKKVLDDKI